VTESAPTGPEARRDRARHYLAEREDRIAWIMGSSRSGSTWLLEMLGELSGTVTIDDPHIGHHLGVWRPLALAWATACERPVLGELRELKREKDDYFFSDRYRDQWMPALRDLIRARFAAQLADAPEFPHGPATLIVKEPGSQAADLLFDAMPASRLIFLVRDGRDVVDSWLHAYREGSWAISEGAYPVKANGRQALIEWLASVWSYRMRTVAAVFSRLRDDQRVLVRYEELLDEPERELGRICEALAIAADEADLRRVGAEHEYEAVGAQDRGPLRAVRAAEPGGWRQSMSLAEQEAMAAIMDSELERFGYLSDVTAKHVPAAR
jgi:hypothetical protein